MKKLFLSYFLIVFVPIISHADTFTVTTNQDIVDENDGLLSFREAIDLANSTPGLDIIEFASTANGTITIAGMISNDNDNTSGAFYIDDNEGIIINGNGEDATILDGNNNVHIVIIVVSGPFTMRNLSIRNGLRGTLINALGTTGNLGGNILVEQCTFQNNVTTNTAGGGLASLREKDLFRIVNCTFLNNAAEFGGGLLSQGDFNRTEIENCTFEQNFANLFQGGALSISASNGISFINNCRFNNNSSTRGRGGAVRLSKTNGIFYLDKCSFTNNQCPGDGGALGVDASDGKVFLSNSFFTNNTSEQQGGALSTSAGGVSVNITNTTFNNNRAIGGGGAIYASSSDGQVNLNFVTISNNIADDEATGNGDGGAILIGTSVSTITYKNSIIQGNDDETPNQTNADGCANASSARGSTFVSLGGNILDDNGGCPVTNDDSIEDALLAALADNGGNTQTMALQEGSPAIDFAVCDTVDIDQRGIERGANCDAGAFEFRSRDDENAEDLPVFSISQLLFFGLLILLVMSIFFQFKLDS